MKRKEMKKFEKEFKNSSLPIRIEMIQNLFHQWTKQFEDASKKSPKEVLGFVQRCGMWWRELHSSLPPIRDDYYLTDCAFGEYFSQQIDRIIVGIYPRSHSDTLLRSMGLNPELTRSKCDDFFTIEFMEKKV